MSLSFREHASNSPFIDAIWYGRSAQAGTRLAPAGSCWAMLIERAGRATQVSVMGPMTRAMPMPYAAGSEFLVIKFQPGTFITCLPARDLLDAVARLPQTAPDSFWLDGRAWQTPDFDRVDVFIEQLAGRGLLARDDVVDAILNDQPAAISSRSVQRRFLRATGLSYRTIRQIRRARVALELLQRGESIIDTVYEAGYVDQPHLTNALKRLVGQTPAQIAAAHRATAVSL